MSKFMGEQDAENRKTLSVDSVPLDESGLRELLVGERNPSARVHNSRTCISSKFWYTPSWYTLIKCL